ncbi:MAG TPA: AAA family ATPase [Woeseiaceae bacterium]|nr:AAA family ATPase [Woeseiaceae bacterium]
MAVLCTAAIRAGLENHMYVEYFRLQRKPFRANPKGAEVFVGPQTARIVKSMKAALVGGDAVVTVTGPAGIGKTALVARALDAWSQSLEVLRLPRAHLGHDEVVSFLLDQLAVNNAPVGMLRRVLACRAELTRRSRAGRAVCIVVEDAERIGEDALVELEALTSADGADDDGARMVLMGGERLHALLDTPPLARLVQRTRLRFRAEPLNPGELLAYLKHSLRLAGGEYDEIFAADVAPVLHQLCGGVPRLANTIVETVLADAADRKRRPVTAEFVARIGREQFSLDCRLATAPPATATATTTEAAATPEVPRAPAAPAGRTATPNGRVAAATASGKAPHSAKSETGDRGRDTLPDLDVLAPDLAGRVAAGDESAEIPTLFTSTRMAAPTPADALDDPPVAVAEPGPTQGENTPAAPVARTPAASPARPPATPAARTPATPAARTPAAPAARPAATAGTPVTPTAPEEPAPVLAKSAEPVVTAPASDSAANDVPAWDKDPTLAELRPDLEALELAIASIAEDAPAKRPVSADTEVPVVELRDPTLGGVPAITLDVAIQQKIAEATEALRKHDATIAEEELDAPQAVTPAGPAAAPKPTAALPAARPKPGAATAPAPPKPAPAASTPAVRPAPARPAAPDARADDMKMVAESLAKARSLEDVDDRMAETLFGEEFSALAAAVAANAPMPEDGAASGGAPARVHAVTGGNDNEGSGTSGDTESVESAMEREFREVYGAEAIEVSLQGDRPRGGLDLSASQRLATVRALNAERKLSESARVRMPAANGGVRVPRTVPAQSIEEQISTSLTQTLKTLSVRPANDDDDDDDGERKGGFFSRFRKH